MENGMTLLRGLLGFVLMTVVVNGCASFNSYQEEGVLSMTGLQQPVKVIRDEKGMPYIYADNLSDAFQTMGFVTAQDRLFQMELTRMVAAGRISELVGEKALPLDRRMRTIGIYRLADRHACLLREDATVLLRKYIDGVNAFVEGYPDDHHLEFKLSGIQPTPWTLTDVLSIMYYMSWSTSANVKTEIITQMLIDRLGPEKAEELFPLNVNPDEDAAPPPVQPFAADCPLTLDLLEDRNLLGFLDDTPLTAGSNNWAVSPAMSPGSKPILANDPHLDARILPGPWYPCGLMTPALRIVGAHIPGLPAMPIFRNDALAAGITNAYADVQDLYVETIDPADSERYLEGHVSIPFEVIEETLRYKDDEAPEGFSEETLAIRLTKRGPVISDVFSQLETDRVLSLRWASAESMAADNDFTRMMQAKSAVSFREALRQWKTIQLNFVFADRQGDIGWHVSGMLPNRSLGGGTVPYVVRDSQDNWTGWIPFEDMPRARNPAKGWVGTCNHKTVDADYPYYYSSYFASSYRYRRLKALMAERSEIAVDDHWQFQRDTRNVMAEVLVPIMVPALMAHEDTRAMGTMLSGWNRQDDENLVAPTIFHAVYGRWAMVVFQDELGDALTRSMLGTWYFWQERFQRMVEDGQSPWFDDVTTTDTRETMPDMLYRAAREAHRDLASRFGGNLTQWQWGKAHTIEFVSPIRRNGFGKGLLGGGRHPMSGSGETLLRGQYDFKQPFDISFSASLRMVADLNDPDKVLAVIPGGVSGRVFHPHAKDQIDAFISGEKQYWWFSDKEIKAHMQSELILRP
jgi:penicillin G amidase